MTVMSNIFCIAVRPANGPPFHNVVAPLDFEAWIQALLVQFETQGKLAEAAGISESAFSRQVRGSGLGIKPLLKLALATGESASAVLRRAKKSDLADLLEQCYGPPRVMNPSIRRVTDEVSDLPESLVELIADWIVQWKVHGLSRESSVGPTPAAVGSTRSRRSKRGNRKGKGKRDDEPTKTP